jgi:hypothetical protein
MKRVFGLAASAGLVFAATAANAQMLAPYRAVSDFDRPYERPYGAVPPAPPPPVYNYGAYGPPPGLMPLPEVYAVLRDNGFSPLGVPYQRGFVYTVAVIDRNGEDGRLVIDGRNGRIIRFVPADPGWGSNWGPGGGRGGYDESFNAVPVPGYGPQGALPPPSVIRGVPRPPASVPHVASRAVPLPAPKPAVLAKPPEVAPQRSAAVEPKPDVRPAPSPATPPASAPPAPSAQTAQTTPPAQANAAPPATVGEAKPALVIRPTQPMPAAQGLE